MQLFVDSVVLSYTFIIKSGYFITVHPIEVIYIVYDEQLHCLLQIVVKLSISYTKIKFI